MKDGDVNETVRVGIWSVVLDVNRREYVQYSDVFERSTSLIEDVLKRDADVFCRSDASYD
ncbi:MAG: hypothetical protein HC817_14175 [Saprospiraceae bacterium]|nr:hypothetical protein [Saprospiraceae bacterium]